MLHFCHPLSILILSRGLHHALPSIHSIENVSSFLSHLLSSIPPHLDLAMSRFTMLYSEMPDMSALDHDFLQLQQHQRRSPQPNSVERVAGGSSGERTGIPYIPPGNGRTSLAPPPGLGNWNGNNHIGNEPTPPPPDDPYGSNVGGSGGSMHERLPTPQQRPTHHDSKDSNNFCRGPLRTNNSTNEWPHPNQRLPANLQGNPTLDPRTATSRRR